MDEQDEMHRSDGLFEHYRFKVDPKQTPLRIDKFVQGKIENITRSRIQRAIQEEAILVNDKIVKSNYKVRPLDNIVIVMPTAPREKMLPKPEDLNLDIRYEDEHILIVHKPVGLVVHPGVGNQNGTLINGLLFHLSGKGDLPIMSGNDHTRPGLVHRIDKNTSGLLVIAKTEQAIAHLSKQFYDHKIDREYIALVWGNFDEKKGTINAPIGRHPKDRLKQHVFTDSSFGKHAVTHYEVLEDLYYVSVIKCKLETGRTHQIRVHLSHIGHPLFNDEKYGGDSIRKGTVFSKYKQFVHNVFSVIPRHALHAKSLGFIHPATNEYVSFDSELPTDIGQALDKWRHYTTHQKQKR